MCKRGGKGEDVHAITSEDFLTGKMVWRVSCVCGGGVR